jgi:hypothetical protein
VSKRIDKTSRYQSEYRFGKHRFEHWYVDNQVYFITGRCRDQYPAFASNKAKTIFWDRFDHYASQAEFFPWITALLDNRYHTLAYVRRGEGLRWMMQRFHGLVAKLVNDTLAEQTSACSKPLNLNEQRRLVPFWRDGRSRDFFDGCIRDTLQCRRAYRYVRTQCRRHCVCDDSTDPLRTRIDLHLEPALRRAVELGAFMEDVPYPRYERRGRAR